MGAFSVTFIPAPLCIHVLVSGNSCLPHAYAPPFFYIKATPLTSMRHVLVISIHPTLYELQALFTFMVGTFFVSCTLNLVTHVPVVVVFYSAVVF